MDISEIKDSTQIKAMIYDQLIIERQAQNNISALESRLIEIQKEADTTVDVKESSLDKEAS